MKKILLILACISLGITSLHANFVVEQVDRLICSIDDQGKAQIADALVIVDVTGLTDQLVATIQNPPAGFELVDNKLLNRGSSLTFSTANGVVEFRLTYTRTDFETIRGTSINIQLVGGSSNRIITIPVVEQPIITFLPTDGKGRYKIKRTDKSGIEYEMLSNDKNSIQLEVSEEAESFVELTLIEDIDEDVYEYVFFGWQVFENYGTSSETCTYISYDKSVTYHFDKSVVVRPEFIPEEWAHYVIKADRSTKYYDLNKAIEKAKTGSGDGKVIVVHKDGVLPKGNYSIPSGVTLLVPGDDDYKCVTSALTADDYLEATYSEAANKCYRKWTIEEGANIAVESGGNICIYAKMLIQGQTILSFPYQYGHVEIRDGAIIDLKSGANLFAWGYITNPDGTQVNEHNTEQVGRVNAQSGSTVWESFQFYDFRGGSATINFVNISIVSSINL
jgi:hypothetical protein